MAVLEVGRLHARYHDVDAAEARVLDDALREVADVGLAASLLDVAVPDLHAVCIRTLEVHLELDVHDTRRALVRSWASAIAAALDDDLRAHGIGARSAGGPPSSPDGRIVVYPCEHDVVVDLVRSTARGDSSRAWAWQRCGVLPTTAVRATAPDCVRLLAARPWLVQAVVRAAGPELATLLDVDGWIEVAQAVARAVGVPTRPVGESTTAPALASEAVGRARAVLPDAVWRAAADRDRDRTLAVLALVCVAPTLLRRTGALDAVASAAAGSAAGSADPRGSGTGDSEGSTAPSKTAGRAAQASGDRTPRPETLASPEARPSGTGDDQEPAPVDPVEPISSEWGGVLYLVHGVSALDLPSALDAAPLAGLDGPTVLAHVLAGVSGVPTDDPAVRSAAGCRVGADPEPLAALVGPAAAEVEHLVDRLRDWVAERLVADHDPTWPWARRATLVVEPGWIEATFSLDDVDTRIRAAGLDLDPGFVWWLGSVVRFRHV